MINKKGELTTQQIVTIVILIISFGVILFLLFRLNLGETTDEEMCHNSVLLKKSTIDAVTDAPLDCRTSYICISGGKDCDNLNYDKKEIVEDPKNKDQIFEVLADKMATCWWMFGEGKVDYAKNTGGYHCAICSSIKFDEVLQDPANKLGPIKYIELYQYMATHDITEKESYLEYIYGVNDVNKLGRMIGDDFGRIDFNEEFSLSDKFSIITGLDAAAILNGWGFFPNDDVIFPKFVKADKVISKTKCNVFDITKA